MKKTLLCVLIFGLIILCWIVLHKSGPESRPNIVLISIDCWRGDYFSPEHTPLTFGWAKENCIIFGNVYSDSTWTKPSHASLLTGLSPKEHGLEYFDGVLSRDIPTVPLKLGDFGYYSCAFTGSGHVSEKWGFSKDFDAWSEFYPEPQKMYFSQFLKPFEKSKEALANARSEPVFTFIHTYYVHQYRVIQSDITDDMLGDHKK